MAIRQFILASLVCCGNAIILRLTRQATSNTICELLSARQLLVAVAALEPSLLWQHSYLKTRQGLSIGVFLHTLKGHHAFKGRAYVLNRDVSIVWVLIRAWPRLWVLETKLKHNYRTSSSRSRARKRILSCDAASSVVCSNCPDSSHLKLGHKQHFISVTFCAPIDHWYHCSCTLQYKCTFVCCR